MNNAVVNVIFRFLCVPVLILLGRYLIAESIDYCYNYD